MLSFPEVFVSSARESDRNRINKGVCNLDREKNRISLFFIESPDFFSWVSRFSFIRGWQVWHHQRYMVLLQLQLYVLTIIRVTLRRIHKPLGESPHFVSLNIPFLVKGTKKVSFISLQ